MRSTGAHHTYHLHQASSSCITICQCIRLRTANPDDCPLRSKFRDHRIGGAEMAAVAEGPHALHWRSMALGLASREPSTGAAGVCAGGGGGGAATPAAATTTTTATAVVVVALGPHALQIASHRPAQQSAAAVVALPLLRAVARAMPNLCT